MASFKDRIERLDQLAELIPLYGREEDCPDAGRLLVRLPTHYAHHASPNAQRRAIQRDLEELVRNERIQPVNPGGKPLRYRRCRDGVESDPYLWEYARQTIRNIVQAEAPVGQLDAVWKRLLNSESEVALDERKLRIVSDSQRLQAAALREGVLADVLEALACSLTLKIGYRDAAGKVTHPVIHPQALLQRGSRIYLFALKNDEAEVRLYALHRVTSSAVGDTPARAAEGFDLDREIHSGNADFADGTLIELVIRARGYVANLLLECALSASQRIEDEEEESAFEIRVTATVPATGQLLRWLLGCGDKVEVLGPPSLRTVVAAQTAKAARLYA